MRRSGVRIPLAPPQADIRSGCRFFVCSGALVWCLLLCCSWRRWCSGRRRARPPARLGGLTSFGAAPRSPPVPSGPSGALHTGGAWSLICGSARRLEAQPSPAAAHRHRGLVPPLPTGVAGHSRETVIAFAGVCSVSGETDDTIASQIHLFSAQFWRAKASWVSWRRPEAPALVLTVSSCGAVSRMGTTKFAQRRLSMAIAR